ncbi:MAG: zinc-finger domain-containing protein [Alphaproteobacteria bacterium]
MSEAICITTKDDVTPTTHRRVVCDGPVGSRHPRVYLTMVDDLAGKPSHVVCPYCSKVFKYIGNGQPEAH